MSTFDSVLELISSSMLVITALLLLVNFKEGQYHFVALGLYLMQHVFVNLSQAGIIGTDGNITAFIFACHKLLSTPLLILFLQYFNNDASKKRSWYMLGSFMLFEIAVVSIFGIRSIAGHTLIVGTGLLLLTGFSFYYFMQQLNKKSHSSKDSGKIFLAGALVFANLCFNLIYVIDYIMQSPNAKDINVINDFTLIILSIILIIGSVMIAFSKETARKNIMKSKEDDVNAFQFL